MAEDNPDEGVDEREQARRDRRWQQLQQRPTAGMTGPLAQVISIFAPAQQHAFRQQQEDKVAPAPTHTDEGLDVDLEKGVVTLRPKKA